MSSHRQTGPAPQPETEERRLVDPGITDLSRRDYAAIAVRAGKEALAHGITDSAAALAYYAFHALPAVLLVTVGLFGLLAGPAAIDTVVERLATVAPAEAVTLVRENLTRLTENRGGSLVMVLVGTLLAVWTATGAMTALMRALNRAYDREETRGFVRQRATALGMLALTAGVFMLTYGLLVLGPYLSAWVGRAAGSEKTVGWIWWTAQWPILLFGLLAAFAAVLYLGPDVDHPRWRFLSPGAVFAVLVWLGASGLFAFYVSKFGSYNKTWGSLASVIVMLTWLWLSGVILLLAAEVNAEAERSRELRRGEPAKLDLQAPPKG
jgi:membrane protein